MMFKYELVFYNDGKLQTAKGYIPGADSWEIAVSVLVNMYSEKQLDEIKLLKPVANSVSCLELKLDSSFLDVEQNFEEYLW